MSSARPMTRSTLMVFTVHSTVMGSWVLTHDHMKSIQSVIDRDLRYFHHVFTALMQINETGCRSTILYAARKIVDSKSAPSTVNTKLLRFEMLTGCGKTFAKTTTGNQ